MARKGATGNNKNKRICASPGCNNYTVITCKYCNRGLCEYHSQPMIVTSLNSIENIDRSKDYIKWKKYNDDWQRKDGHPCVEYTEWWNKKNEEAKNREHDVWKKLPHKEQHWYTKSSSPYTQSYTNSTYTTTSSSRPRLKVPSWLYQRWILKEVLIVSLILTVLITLPIGLVNLANSALSASLLTSPIFLWNFIVICILMILYGKVAAHGAHLWQAATISLVNSTVLLSQMSISTITSVQNFLTVFVILLVSTYMGLIFGSNMTYKGYSKAQKTAAYASKAVVAIVLLLLLANTVINAAPSISSINFYNQTNSIVSNPSRLSNAISGVVNSTKRTLNSLFPVINSTWATQFFENVSIERGAVYNYCPSLSNFAKVRFNTMAQNYEISHYGYNQDFQNYYGVIYNTYFGEEVFYPSGTTPSGQVQQIINDAPLHWQELTSSDYSYYGYYIGNGPTLEILNSCPDTEIPGPNINVAQFFAQQGCTTEVTNQTWFVIELASSCP